MIPAGLTEATLLREGEAGRHWLAELPRLVAQACAAWACTVDGPPSHGEVALVVPVRHARGPAVLKVSFPHPGNLGEAAALRTFAGRGAVQLREADASGLVLLLERAGPTTLAESKRPVEEMIELLGQLARQLAVAAGPGVTPLADTIPGWLEELDAQLATHPQALPARATDRAIETIRHLGQDTTSTMLHGDLHAGNVLAAVREPWLAIDAKGWSGTAAFDAFTASVARRTELDPESGLGTAIAARVRRFAAAAGVEADLALACAQARAVSSYLYRRAVPGNWFDDAFLWALAVG